MLNKDYYILLSILGNIEKILKYSSGYESAVAFYENDRDFDASMMNFIVIGEQVGKLSDELKNNNPQIDWSKIYSFRNIIAHHYFGINVDIVWQIIQNDLKNFRKNISILVK